VGSVEAVPVDFMALDERALVALAQQGTAGAFRAIMARNNRRLFRVARSIMQDDSEAEDVVQEGYVRVFAGLAEFRGESSLATWLTRVILNEALGRVRRKRPTVELDILDAPGSSESARVILFPSGSGDGDPERAAARQEISRLIRRVVDDLPEPFRVVFMMRAVEEMSIEETALCLGLRPETVKTRLHRARRLLRDALDSRFASALADSFPFEGQRCARVADAVLARLWDELLPHPERSRLAMPANL
jgi:RNA polymerase sigma-70 factor, ECF subfamily